MKRIVKRIIIGIMSSLFYLTGAAADPAPRKPNLVVILCDDLGYGDLGCYGNTAIRTPRLDAMAAAGTRLTDFYAASPVCSPSRAALLTGCYPMRVGVSSIIEDLDQAGLPPEEVTLAEIVKPQGYATACIGKWHLGHRPQFLPTNQGFDYYFGVPYSTNMRTDPSIPVASNCLWRLDMSPERLQTGPLRRGQVPLMRNMEVIESPVDQTALTERYTEEALLFIRANRTRPFLLYLAHTLPHKPMKVSARFKEKSAAGPYGDAVECIDWSTGVIMDELAVLGLERDTIVVFTSDNGPATSKVKGTFLGSSGPFSGAKRSTNEGGLRIPCIWWAPGRIPAGGICSEMVLMMDIFPTFAGLAGATLPLNRTIDGKNAWNHLNGTPDAAPLHEFFIYYDDRARAAAIRSGPWKLHLSNGEGDALYSLDLDPAEENNVATLRPDLASRLKAELKQADRSIRRKSKR